MARLQFTIRTMLIFVSYLALSLGCFRVAVALPGSVWAIVLWLAGIMSLGAGIGVMFNKQLAGALVAGIIALLLPCALSALFGPP